MKKTIKASHGTNWEGLIPEEPYLTQAAFFNLNTDKNDLKVFFLSENDFVCDIFSNMKHFDDELQMQVMIVGDVTLDDETVIYNNYQVGKKVEYNGEKYDYSCNDDRELLYEKLKEDGITAFVMKNDYDTELGKGDDIAVLDGSIFESKSIKIKNRFGEWSNEMSYDDAKGEFLKFMNGETLDKEGLENYGSFRGGLVDEEESLQFSI